jgi:hypothetical protein
MEGEKRPVVMPDGSVFACCNDFGCELSIGNLLIQKWGDLDFEKVKSLQRDPKSYSLCFRGCHLAERQVKL